MADDGAIAEPGAGSALTLAVVAAALLLAGVWLLGSRREAPESFIDRRVLQMPAPWPGTDKLHPQSRPPSPDMPGLSAPPGVGPPGMMPPPPIQSVPSPLMPGSP
jgi:hypothetical protein